MQFFPENWRTQARYVRFIKSICAVFSFNMYTRVDRQSRTCKKKNNTTHFYSLMGIQERLQWFFLIKHFAFLCHGHDKMVKIAIVTFFYSFFCHILRSHLPVKNATTHPTIYY